jgi:hypothetical protein
MGHLIEHSRAWIGLGRYRIMCIAHYFIVYAVYHLVMQSTLLSKRARLYLSHGTLDWQIHDCQQRQKLEHFYYRTHFCVGTRTVRPRFLFRA